MSGPSVVPFFEATIGPALPSPLDILIRRQLELAAKQVAEDQPQHGTLGVAQNTGEYLTSIAQVLAHLSEELVHGDLLQQEITSAHDTSADHSGLADYRTIAQMETDTEKLRQIHELTERFSADVLKVWRPACKVEPDMSPASTSLSRYEEFKSETLSCSPLAPSSLEAGTNGVLTGKQCSDTQGSREDSASGSGDSDDDEDLQFLNIDMRALGTRGKGNYTCPLSHRCDKGGVDKDGKLIVFDRNSSFAQHCNKHRKPWRCDLEGCPNPKKKRKFARRDGLERHKATVKHRVVT